MNGDIKLDGVWVVLEGDVVRTTAYCVMLDREERRTQTGGYRRAIEHGPNDQVVVNYEGDYPGGVKLMGTVEMPGRVEIVIQEPDMRRLEAGVPIGMRSVRINLNDEIMSLRQRIAELESRLP